MLLALLCSLGASAASGDGQWRTHGGDPAQTRYSNLRQINKANVATLERAWIYQTGDAGGRFSQIQCTPIIVDGVLYATTPSLAVVALQAATGRELWRYAPFRDRAAAAQGINRGVTYWSDGEDRRILHSAGPYLHALDAENGRPIAGFGMDGRIDLRLGLQREPSGLSVDATSPGVIFEDLVIMGSRVGEGAGAAPGHVRAYEVRSGKLAWIFHTIPHPGEFGHETWPPDAWRYAGGANAWTGMSVDHQRSLVFVATGSATYDFYGGDRLGDNLFANSLIALDARTGRRRWHFQTVHHDLWDRDLATPPSLVSLRRDGRRIDAVVQVTKQGFTFVFDRETGEPFHAVEERAVPRSNLPGEQAAATQPIPVKPPPFARQTFPSEEIAALTPQARAELKTRWQALRKGDLYLPPDLSETLIFPGFDGGAEWGGAAFDPDSRLLYVNASDVPYTLRMIPLSGSMGSQGRHLYLRHCAGCHGIELAGNELDIPPLDGIRERYSLPTLYQLIRGGRGRMPAFAHLPFEEAMPLMTYLLENDRDADATERESTGSPNGAPDAYMHTGYNRFTDSYLGAPAIAPPWGTLNAIDLERGEIRWRIPLGHYPDLAADGWTGTGAENYGGPVVTAGGLVFIGATPDEKFRAFDKETGELLWETDLPAAGFATPATYMVNGRQFVVIAAGGGKLGRPPGDSYVAFALPE